MVAPAVCVVEDNSPAIGSGGRLVEAIGVRVEEHTVTLLQEGVDVPCEKKGIFSTADHDQTEILVNLYRGYRGNGVAISACVWLGEFAIQGFAAAAAGAPNIEVTVAVENRRIELRATDLNDRRQLSIGRRTQNGFEH